MEFGRLGQLLLGKFKEHLTEENYFKAAQWHLTQQVVPMSFEPGRPWDVYDERMAIFAYEPNPTSTDQLSLEYTIIQSDTFYKPGEIASLASRAIREREPKQFASHWSEYLLLGVNGCFGGGTYLTYSFEVNAPGSSLDRDETVYIMSGTATAKENKVSYRLEDKHMKLPDELQRMSQVLTQPEMVLDLFVGLWVAGNGQLIKRE